MNPITAVAISSLTVTIVCLAASFMLRDPPGSKPAALAFRGAFFVVIVMAALDGALSIRHSLLLEVIYDLNIASANALVTIGFIWRCQSTITVRLILVIAVTYFVLDTLVVALGTEIGYLYSGVLHTITCVVIVRRRPARNVADTALVLLFAAWAMLDVSQAYPRFVEYFESPFAGAVSNEVYSALQATYFAFLPGFLCGLGIFLVASYTLDATDALDKLATTDPLTGLHNRRYLIDESRRIVAMSERHHFPIGIIMCDIDKFKDVNDTHGHDAGDAVIVAFALALQGCVRADDILARWGGEEFVALLAQTDADQARELAERMRTAAAALEVQTHGKTLMFTASFGVTQLDGGCDAEEGIRRADEAMYHAKESGRNRVEVYAA